MKKLFAVTLSAMLTSQVCFAQNDQYKYDPPWNTPPQNGVPFTIPGIDNVPDLYGDVNDPQLVMFFAGNQFMVIGELLSAFREEHPEYIRIFVETLPPGILAKQVEQGALVVGNMRIDLKPDVYAAGKQRIQDNKDWFPYAQNKLAIMVRQGNPQHIKSLRDLGKDNVNVSMPNPEWEGIGRRIEEAYVKAGGEELKRRIMQEKVKDQSTFLTHIHHRQTPLRVLRKESDAGPVWYTEVFYQKMIGHPVELVELPAKENVTATYQIGVMKTAPHPQAAEAFANFLTGPAGQAIYKKYGFLPPQ